VFLTSWERFTRAGVAWPACPPGGGRGASRAVECGPDGEHVLGNYLLAAVFESKALADRPSPGVLFA
jgi:hypothetical protein